MMHLQRCRIASSSQSPQFLQICSSSKHLSEPLIPWPQKKICDPF